MHDRAVILMVVKENETNVYGQRKFESIMVLRYRISMIYAYFIHMYTYTSYIIVACISLQVQDKSDTT